MTKAEFSQQFKRLRIAGYRLPVFDDVKIGEVVDEWFGTFGSCSVTEFAHAIDKLKQTKTDTFWPSSGELWTHIFQDRKERRIRREAENPGHESTLSPERRQEFLSAFREFQQQLIAKMTMPHAEPQTAPQHVLDEQARREEDEAV